MRTQNKRTAHLLAEVNQARERYINLINSIDGIVWEADVQTFQFTFVSQQAERLLGYPVAQWLADANFWRDHIHPEDQEWAVNFCLTSTAEKRPHQFDYRMLAADGRVVWLRDRATVVVENDQPVTVRGIMIDITAQKQAEAERRQLQEQLFQAQKLEAVGILSGGIAHDFNNILAIIMGFAELTVDEVTAGSEAHRNLEQILMAGRRAATVVRQLLDFSRITVHEAQEVELSRIIEETLIFLRALIPSSIQLRTRLACQEAWVWGNPTQLQQVLLNLCANSAQAIRENRGSIEIELQEEQKNGQALSPSLEALPYLRLTVRDTGCGIPPEVEKRIFEPFFTTKPAGEGSGLGLAVVHGIVMNHGGTLSVQSQLGEGTAVHIYLPRRKRSIC